ncbi:MAG: NAD(P)/FAD-dependent oxidoreductase [Candidatus Zixiibacteriota bacterium]
MRIAIVGGGAAGFFGAIAAATCNRSAEIILFEATHQPLDKVRISGGGRCNVTHQCFDPVELIKNYPRGSRELLAPFKRFQPRDTVDWFEQHGVRLKTEPDGRMFPITDQSSTIVDCLLNVAETCGVQLRLGARIKNVESSMQNGEPRFELTLHDNSYQSCDRVLIATGSSPQGYRFAQSLGHTIIPCVPSLFTFKISDPRLDGLAGVSFENVSLTIIDSIGKKLRHPGPILITHWGLSGPAVLKLSAWGAKTLNRDTYHARLTVNFFPEQSREQLLQKLSVYRENNGKKQVHVDPPVALPRRYWRRIVHVSGVDVETTWTHVTRSAINAIVTELNAAQFDIVGKGIFKEEFVTCGGVSLKEIDFRTMQSRLCTGLYFAGEILDIDGITGGFNFQSAWTTGWIAGENMAGK